MSKQTYINAAQLLKNLKKKIDAYDTAVAKAGFGYSLSDELTYILNASPIYEIDEIKKTINYIEERSGVKFDWES